MQDATDTAFRPAWRLEFNDLAPGLDALRVTVIRPKRAFTGRRRRARLPKGLHRLDSHAGPTRPPDEADQCAVVQPRVQGFEPRQLLPHGGWDVPARTLAALWGQASPGAGSGVCTSGSCRGASPFPAPVGARSPSARGPTGASAHSAMASARQNAVGAAHTPPAPPPGSPSLGMSVEGLVAYRWVPVTRL